MAGMGGRLDKDIGSATSLYSVSAETSIDEDGTEAEASPPSPVPVDMFMSWRVSITVGMSTLNDDGRG